MAEYVESLLIETVATVTNEINDVDVDSALKVKEYLEKNKLAVLQLRLGILLSKSTDGILKDSPAFRWILNDVGTLEQILNSGYVAKHRWVSAINILEDILEADSTVKTSSYHKRIAVAIALTFSTPVLSAASYTTISIDPLKRYLTFVKCAKEEKFFPVHKTLSTWLLRYVVASWAEDDELEWARNNIPVEFKCPGKVGESTHSMVKYKEYNDKGVSIQDGAAFYDNKPCTLELLKDYGAVCGGVSKFGTCMAQAFGIPACPIAQPGHCAFLWWKKGEWVMSNDCSGITESTTHAGIQWSWNERCDYQLLFDKAQKDFENYSLSEQLRCMVSLVDDYIVQMELFDLAIHTCPTNYLIWQELACFLTEKLSVAIKKKDRNFRDRIELYYNNVFKSLTLKEESNTIISAFSKVTSSVEENVSNVIDGGGSEWFCREKEAWIEIDFENLINISSIEIQWWGISFAMKYSISAVTEENNGEYNKEKTEYDAYESPKSRSEYNAWSKLTGWTKPTRKIKFSFSDGCLDPWNMNVYIGIRQINVYGGRYDNSENTNITTDLNDTMKTYMERRICKNFVDFPLIGKDLLKLLAPVGEVLSRHCVITSSVQSKVENLVDGTNTEWYCKENEAWIELDLGRLCTICCMEMCWWGISFAKQYTIHAAGANGCYSDIVKTEKDAYEGPKTTSDYNTWTKLTGWSVPTRKIKILLKDGCLDPWGRNVLIGMREIVIKGFSTQ